MSQKKFPLPASVSKTIEYLKIDFANEILHGRKELNPEKWSPFLGLVLADELIEEWNHNQTWAKEYLEKHFGKAAIRAAIVVSNKMKGKTYAKEMEKREKEKAYENTNNKEEQERIKKEIKKIEGELKNLKYWSIDIDNYPKKLKYYDWWTDLYCMLVGQYGYKKNKKIDFGENEEPEFCEKKKPVLRDYKGESAIVYWLNTVFPRLISKIGETKDPDMIIGIEPGPIGDSDGPIDGPEDPNPSPIDDVIMEELKKKLEDFKLGLENFWSECSKRKKNVLSYWIAKYEKRIKELKDKKVELKNGYNHPNIAEVGLETEYTKEGKKKDKKEYNTNGACYVFKIRDTDMREAYKLLGGETNTVKPIVSELKESWEEFLKKYQKSFDSVIDIKLFVATLSKFIDNDNQQNNDLNL